MDRGNLQQSHLVCFMFYKKWKWSIIFICFLLSHTMRNDFYILNFYIVALYTFIMHTKYLM